MNGEAPSQNEASGMEVGTASRMELVPSGAVIQALSEVVSHPGVPALAWNGEELSGWWRGSRRFPLRWSLGRWSGQGFVEVTPLTRQSCQLEVTLMQPPGLPARLVWPRRRLATAANDVAAALRRGTELASRGRVLPFARPSMANRGAIDAGPAALGASG
jgi:hypothetical protein